MSKRSRSKSTKPHSAPADKKARSRRERSAKISKAPEASSRKRSRRGKKSVVEEVATSAVEAAMPVVASVMTAPVIAAPRKKPRAAPSAPVPVVSARKGAHPKHPPCPSCGKALYKSPEPKQVKTSDPWAFCRNKACSLCGKDQSKIPAPAPAAVQAPAVQEPVPAEAESAS